MSIQKNKLSTTQLLKNFLSPKKTKIIVISTLLFFAILALPEPIKELGGGLDPSWRVALHLAKLKELVWGTEVVFTYGPLGYLTHPVNIDGSIWNQAFLYQTMTHFLFFFVIGIFSLKSKYPIITAVTLGVSFVYLIGWIPIEIPVIGIFLGFFLYLEYSKKFFLLIPLAFASAFLFFIKGDAAFGAMSILILSCIVLLTKKRIKEGTICLISYFSFLIIIWSAMNYSVTQFFDYVTNQSHIVSGYTVAMSKDWATPWIIIAILGWVLYFWWIVDATRKNRGNLPFLFISGGIFFILFRLGFVREDHIPIYFPFLAALFLIYFFIDKTTKKNNFLKLSTIVMVIVLIFSGSYAFTERHKAKMDISEPIEIWKYSQNFHVYPYKKLEILNYPKSIQFFFNDDSFKPTRITEKNAIKSEYPEIPKEISNMLKNQTVDVYPWDISFLYVNDLNWHPRPVLGSYNSYNVPLDNLDAQFYQQKSSPKYIFHKFLGLDVRYPIFDEPATTRAMLCEYHKITNLKMFSVLEKNLESICLEEILIDEIEVKFGDEVIVPSDQQGFVFGKIYVKQNALGKISNSLYKSPKVFIQLNDDEKKFRFIYPTAENGIILFASKDLEFQSNIMKENIKSFVISTDYENFFEEKIKIEFVLVKTKAATVS